MTSDQSAASDPPRSNAGSTTKKASRIANEARAAAGDVAEQARHIGSSMVESISEFVASRPLT